MSDQQLTEDKLYQISLLLAQGSYVVMIFRTAKVYQSTVSRELKCNSNLDVWEPNMALMN
ncbi:hypothetical protein AYI85_08175 [Shewanella algae]|nr:hypothetical protein AYI85_08175 [Shewanella algae]TVL01612.1 hypothetical protein AYI84_15065 [Shewanella algae]